MGWGRLIRNPEIGKTPRQLDKEIKHVTVERTLRRGNNLTTEDQDARIANLRDARGRVN